MTKRKIAAIGESKEEAERNLIQVIQKWHSTKKNMRIMDQSAEQLANSKWRVTAIIEFEIEA